MNALTTISFHGANLVAIPGETPETTMVAVRPVAEGMGLNFDGQRKRLARHPVLGICTAVLTVQMPGDDQVREHTFLPLNRLHFWLATISPNHVPDPAIRESVILYQTEAADALFSHFFGKVLAGKDNEIALHTNGMSEALVRDVTSLRRTVDNLTIEVRGMIIAHDPRRAVLAYVSVHQLLEEAKAISKGRKSLNGKIGYALRSIAATNPPADPPFRCPHSKVWLFPRTFAEAYMRERGNALVSEHNDHQRGQVRLPLVRPTVLKGGKDA